MADEPSQNEWFARLLQEHGTNRRTFLLNAAAIGASVSSASAFLAACGGDDEGSQQADAPPPKRGGSVQVGMTDFFSTDTIDPAQPVSGFGLMHAANVFETLTDVDKNFGTRAAPRRPNGSPSDAATVWTFQLREGSRVPRRQDPDGRRRRASASSASSIEKTAASFLPLIDGIVDPKRVVAVDPNTVRFQLARRTRVLPRAGSGGLVRSCPDGQQDFTKPAGTGPYRVDEYKQGERVEWSRNANYWVNGKPLLDSVRILQFQDPATKVESVISGDLDIADPVEFTALPTVDQASTVQRVAPAGRSVRAHLVRPDPGALQRPPGPPGLQARHRQGAVRDRGVRRRRHGDG